MMFCNSLCYCVFCVWGHLTGQQASQRSALQSKTQLTSQASHSCGSSQWWRFLRATSLHAQKRKTRVSIILKLIILQCLACTFNRLCSTGVEKWPISLSFTGVHTKQWRCPTQLLRLSTRLEPPPAVVQCSQQRMNFLLLKTLFVEIWFGFRFCGTFVVKLEVCFLIIMIMVMN